MHGETIKGLYFHCYITYALYIGNNCCVFYADRYGYGCALKWL